MGNRNKTLLKTAFAAAALLTAGSVLVCSNAPEGEGGDAIVFVKDVVTYPSTKFDVCSADTIHAGHVCIRYKKPDSATRDYFFPHIDYCESLAIGKEYVDYEAPNQDYYPPRYIPLDIFWRSVRTVKLRDPDFCLEEGKVYQYHSDAQYCHDKHLSIKPIRITDPNAVTNWGDSLYSKMVYEIQNEYGKIYMYKGIEIVEDLPYEDLWEGFNTLYIDDTGHCFCKDARGQNRPVSKLGPVSGRYNDCEYFGCISREEIIVDDFLYTLDGRGKDNGKSPFLNRLSK